MAKEISSLTKEKRAEIEKEMFTNGDDLADLEKMQAHFASHPTMPGEKAFKMRVKQHIDNFQSMTADGGNWAPADEKQWLASMYAQTEIRETKFAGSVVDMSKDSITNPETGKEVKQYKEPEENEFKLTPMETNDEKVSTYTLNAELRKVKDGVNIYAKKNPDAARFTKIGTVPENFLANNPMNVSRCPAQICIEDFSGGKLRNVSERLVVESSRMSGDYIELSDDMIVGLEKPAAMEQ